MMEDLQSLSALKRSATFVNCECLWAVVNLKLLAQTSLRPPARSHGQLRTFASSSTLVFCQMREQWYRIAVFRS